MKLFSLGRKTKLDILKMIDLIIFGVSSTWKAQWKNFRLKNKDSYEVTSEVVKQEVNCGRFERIKYMKMCSVSVQDCIVLDVVQFILVIILGVFTEITTHTSWFASIGNTHIQFPHWKSYSELTIPLLGLKLKV